MTTVFDVITVTCFVGLVIAFFQFTNRDTRVLLQFMLSAILFAVANQVGNHGWFVLASILVVAGIAYAAFVTTRANS